MPYVLLGVRFVLEIAMWTGCAMLGWHVLGWLGAIAGLVISTGLWGLFGVRHDGVRQDPPIEIPGWARLVLELALFGIGAWGIWLVWSRAAAETYLTFVVITNGLMWERCRWLLTGKATR
ncbi:MAG TPA: DUF2568 domain-containing protein [Thermomicrobiales bacterium]|nr:DUF2568 domain-containing protein [Thermomicrobiales bacterium]